MLLHLLYRLIISPLEYFLGIVYICLREFFTLKTSLIGMSISVSLLCLPLYLRADAIQEEESRKQKEMEKWTKHIRETFSGDERMMMQNAYYRQQHYHPASALKGTLSLLLQIPFFLAAYHFLSHVGEFEGASALGIADLSRPDGLIKLGAVSINLLPVLMTMINCISGAIYTKGHVLREKLQVYILAVFFLFFLYDSPAALVIYWTMNNIFSLAKNVVTKYCRKPERVLFVFIALIGAAFLGHALIKNKYERLVLMGNYGWLIFGIVLPLVCVLPLILYLAGSRRKPKAEESSAPVIPMSSVLLAGALSALFSGLVIPLSVISSSAQDFVDITDYVDPFIYAASTFAISAGLFLLWGGVIGMLVPDKKRWIFYCLLLWTAAGSLADYFFWGKGFGRLSTALAFSDIPRYSAAEKLINLAVLLVVLLAVFLLAPKHKKTADRICVVVMLSFMVLIIRYTVQARRDVNDMKDTVEAGADDWEAPLISFDRTEKNVAVIMLDRAISGFIPYLFNERPELYEMFDGFTYYPNTVSFGKVTLYGAPALFGGYEYTPTAMNARSGETLVEKHNEALKVMPRLFSEAGYRTMVADMPFGNYQTATDVSLYDDLPKVEAWGLEGHFGSDEGRITDTDLLERNFFFYSMFKSAPVALQTFIYDEGDYLSMSSGMGDRASFMKAWSVLTALPGITEATDNGRGSFLAMDNNTTHSPLLLERPSYTPSESMEGAEPDEEIRINADGKKMNASHPGTMEHYHANMAALLALGEWFDELRELGVYDNTRIIIVADHGGLGENFGFPRIEGVEDVEGVNPLLMVKDFGAEGFDTDNTFMTIGDVPALATEGLITPAVNPYSGKPLDMEGKEDVLITFSMDNTFNVRNLADKYVFDCIKSDWYRVKDDIFEPGNWEKAE
ncbi:MAG: membrane protein insertase YidC [Lachnospiraceae bacterium]|nr:membrane protein insertase YidC [Lachnospiraceae bacterium]